MKLPSFDIGSKIRAFVETVFREKYLARYLVFIWLYSLVIAAFNDRYKMLLQETKSDIPYHGMLMQTERGYHFYDFTNLNFDITSQDLEENTSNDVKILPIAREELALPNAPATQRGTSVSILKDDSILVRNDLMARIFDTAMRENYVLLNEPNVAVTTGATGNIVAIGREGAAETVRIYYAACKNPQSIPLPSSEDQASVFLKEMDIDPESTVILSPTEQYAVILDHDMRRRIVVVDLFAKEVSVLKSPDFGDDQIHFVPRFIDSHTVAFSIMDGQRKGTMLYDLEGQRYGLLSNDFSDAIYVSRNGKIILAQSFHRYAGNVPFGSLALIRRQARIPRSEIASSAKDEDATWRRVFKNPDEELLEFHEDADQRMAIVQDPFLQRIIADYWSQVSDPKIRKEVELKFLEVTTGGAEQKDSIIYFVDAARPRLVWSFDISPLLRLLGFPSSVISQYKGQLSENPNAYNLLDLR